MLIDFQIFSLTDSAINLQRIHIEIFHHTLNMSLHYHVKYECQKTGGNLNDKSQCSIAKHLSWDRFVYYKFIAQFADVRMFKIGEHLAKLRTRVVSCFFDSQCISSSYRPSMDAMRMTIGLLSGMTYIHTHIHTHLYSAKNRENESEALAQDD